MKRVLPCASFRFDEIQRDFILGSEDKEKRKYVISNSARSSGHERTKPRTSLQDICTRARSNSERLKIALEKFKEGGECSMASVKLENE